VPEAHVFAEPQTQTEDLGQEAAEADDTCDWEAGLDASDSARVGVKQKTFSTSTCTVELPTFSLLSMTCGVSARRVLLPHWAVSLCQCTRQPIHVGGGIHPLGKLQLDTQAACMRASVSVSAAAVKQ
jgi:hypothetical protein